MKYIITIYLFLSIYSFCLGQTAEEHYKKGEEIYTQAQIGDKYELTRAIEEFSKAIEKNTKYVKAYRYRGYIKTLLFDFKGAIKDFSKIIEIEPSNLDALEQRALSYSMNKQYNKALQDYNKAIGLAKENKFTLQRLYQWRGVVRLHLNQKENACDDFSKSGELGNSAAYDMIQQYCN